MIGNGTPSTALTPRFQSAAPHFRRHMRPHPLLRFLRPWTICRSESISRKVCACVAGGILLFHAGLNAEIVSVDIERGCGSAAAGNVSVVVGLSTRYSPALLYQPSAFGVSGHELTVVLYPSWGPLAAFDHIVERVDVGTLKGATYRYAVVAVPEAPGFDEPIIVTGSFTVAPILEIISEPGPPGMQGLRLRWEALDEFNLQWRSTLGGEEEWNPVDGEVIQIGDVHSVYIAPSGEQRLFRLAI